MVDNVTRDAVARRLKDARVAAGYASAAEAARALGMKEVTVRAHESGQNAVGAWTAPTYARGYQVTENWILYGHNDRPTTAEIKASVGSIVHGPDRARGLTHSCPIMGEVAAGVWKEVQPRERTDPIGMLQIAVDGYQSADVYALRVVGPSMNQYYPEGRYVIVAPVIEAGLREFDHVVVQRQKSGLVETTLKELVRDGERFLLWPRSTDPSFQEPTILTGDEHDQDAPEVVAVVIADYARRDRNHRPVHREIGDDDTQ